MKKRWKIVLAVFGCCALCTGAFAAGSWLDSLEKDYTITVGERIEIKLDGDAGGTVLPGEPLSITVTPNLGNATGEYQIKLVDVSGTSTAIEMYKSDWQCAVVGDFAPLDSSIGQPLSDVVQNGTAFTFRVRLSADASNVAAYAGKTLVLSLQLVEKNA